VEKKIEGYKDVQLNQDWICEEEEKVLIENRGVRCNFNNPKLILKREREGNNSRIDETSDVSDSMSMIKSTNQSTSIS
jgi:hypothetical protein